mmetsp:Transcript_63286/g.105297  ORF Transcript_63286/g.105297 Transcript_63286/m.105297 type:complete len:104 (+) Transcript_63286:50-361(+)|eukprot:CAMPEP_0119315016 /NCGR_PEP_ID=MMETSP1333-20130426/34173_1 /TAXON_ID=418940 /ORGANISM="Scyphosphaera apsteinii, Strain RCC1455" /LENGTH=103 /DNA_ID=CAMNT_0007320233 /DNA_START=47 /DNA_END=358 /DNA_ORIENTATION=+
MAMEPLNVQRRVQAEETMEKRVGELREMSFALHRCAWEKTRENQDLFASQLHQRKAMNLEIAMANKDVLLHRRARMKEFLAAEAAQFEAQLNEKGLAFAKYRP